MSLNFVNLIFHFKHIKNLVALNLSETLSYHIYEVILTIKDL